MRKSAVGCFHPPERVLLDPAFLGTLPPNLISDGFAEAIKVAVALDISLFEFIERYSREFFQFPYSVKIVKRMTELVWRSTVRLLEELQPNLYEDKTYRRLLDFGHTFSPLIESESGFAISHGMAVAIDIALSTEIAFELGLVSSRDRDRILKLLISVGLPIYSSLLTTESACRALAEMEAHRGGELNLVLPSGIGSAVFVNEKNHLEPKVLRRALDFLLWETESSAAPVSGACADKETQMRIRGTA